ncbi:MAG TPA: hypothetical protein VJS68_02465 [Thermoplasmata archaeon]|nr:hypothetical protein [Thermoplasmata archaeon]
MIVGGVTPHDLVYLKDHDTVLDDNYRRLLRSPVLLLLVDASWLTSEIKSVAGLPMVRYDAALANTLQLLQRFLAAERDKRQRHMFPLFILTKFDRISPEAVDILHIPPAPPPTWEPWARAQVGQRLLQTYLPETARCLGQHNHGTVTVESPAWFFSGLRTQEDASHELRILRRERIPVGGWEPEYPFEEYRALIDQLKELADRLPSEAHD